MTAPRQHPPTRPGNGTTVVNFIQILPSVNLGGAGIVALRIAEHLRRRSRPTGVWCPGDGSSLREAERLGLSPRVFDPSPAFSPGALRAAVVNLNFFKDLRREWPGIAHVHSPYLYRAMSPAIRLARLRSVVHVQLEEDREGLRWAFRRPPELIVTCSRSLIDYVRDCLPERLRERQWIEAVPNAVDTLRFWPADRGMAKERVGAPAGVPLVLMLANLAPHKGQETAIRAVAALKQRGVEVACWLAGVERQANGYSGRLRELIAGLGVGDRVKMLGQRDDAPTCCGRLTSSSSLRRARACRCRSWRPRPPGFQYWRHPPRASPRSSPTGRPAFSSPPMTRPATRTASPNCWRTRKPPGGSRTTRSGLFARDTTGGPTAGPSRACTRRWPTVRRPAVAAAGVRAAPVRLKAPLGGEHDHDTPWVD